MGKKKKTYPSPRLYSKKDAALTNAYRHGVFDIYMNKQKCKKCEIKRLDNKQNIHVFTYYIAALTKFGVVLAATATKLSSFLIFGVAITGELLSLYCWDEVQKISKEIKTLKGIQ